MSYIYIQNKKILDYADEKRNEKVWKYARTSIKPLTVKPNPSVLVDGNADIDITWEADNFTSLTLIPFYKDVTKLRSFSGKLKKTTEISLLAIGDGPDNRATKTVSANVLAKINSFEGNPAAIYYKDFPHDIKLSWDVATNEDVYFENSIDKVTIQRKHIEKV